MRAMVLRSPGLALEPLRRDARAPEAGEVAVAITACGVCRTDLHVVDGELPPVRSPLVPGHEIVGRVVALGDGVSGMAIGDRVGIPWLGWTCGVCRYCRAGQENLCDAARFTGYSIDGGYADYAVADSRFCFPLPDGFSDVELAPWLCAGLIGYRALRKAGDSRRLGIYGFGAAAHIIAAIARFEGRETFAFTRPGDAAAQAFARASGVAWAGGSDEPAPEPLDAAILLAPVGALVPKALRDVVKGGVVVCGGIHMTDIPSFPYEILWGERQVCSVANLTRQDGREFIDLARRMRLRTSVVAFPLEQANEALAALRTGELSGAAVLTTA